MSTEEFEILARDLRPRLVRESAAITGSGPDADDVAQDTMLKLWTLRDSLGEYRSIEAFAVLIARRLALNTVRARHTGRFTELTDASASVPSVEDSMIGRQTGEQLDAVIASLPEAQQTLIRLRHIEGYDNAAIAAILGSSEGAVRTALSRARRRVALAFNISI